MSSDIVGEIATNLSEPVLDKIKEVYNYIRRYKCSKYAKDKATLLHDQSDKVPKDAVTRPLFVEEVKSFIDGYKNCGLQSRKQVMDNVIGKLQDAQVKYIAIYGEENVGKTRLMDEITRKFGWSGTEDYRCFKHPINVGRKSIKDIEINFEDIINLVRQINSTDIKHIVFLDGIWEKFDLQRTGIAELSCVKILMTSREKSLCKEMGVEDCNMFELGRLSEDEARNLFWSKVSFKENIVISEEYLRVADKVVNKCGGLPLPVVTIAAVLSGNTLLYWERFIEKLESGSPSIGGSISQQQLVCGGHDDDDDHDHEYLSILETSYLLLSTQERMMFLLCCLFPSVAVGVPDLMRCAIGLGLIQCVDTLLEAEALVRKWINRLVSSTFVEYVDGQPWCVKIPDLVQRYGALILAKGGNMVMVEAFPRWLLPETCQKYYAISLMSHADHSRLDGLNSDKLQILILDRSQPRDRFSDGFFQGMTNLKVLVFKGMKFTPGLPNSIRKLKRSLRTLLLVECELGNITVIGELTNLVVLSLSLSSVEEIPEGGIAANVLSKLSLLEGLYALIRGGPWRYMNDDSKKGEYSYYARIAELKYLSFLKVLELRVEFNDWAIDDDQLQFLNNLDHFFISFGQFGWAQIPTIGRKYPRGLLFNSNDSWSSIVKDNGVRVLLEKTQSLWVVHMELQHINDDIQQQEEDETKMQLSIIHFPNLIELYVDLCPKIQSLSSTPFKAPNLTHLYVSDCDNMKYIFMEHDADHQLNNAQGDPHTTVTFPRLQQMSLRGLPKLESVTGLIKRGSATTNDDHQPGHHILFKNHKTIFPSLEHLELEWCDKIVQLWEVNCKEMSYYSSFNNLQFLYIGECNKLETLGSLSIATALVQLQKLHIRNCPLLREVISSEEIEAPTFGDKILPSLQSVELDDCPELKVFISGGKHNDEFLKLSSFHQLQIKDCPKMVSFSFEPSFKTPKLNKVILDSSEFSKDEIKDDIYSFLQSHNKPKVIYSAHLGWSDIFGV
ncbi:probable disease resistance protein At1g61310 [Chenopodium quinoa]|uniref:probable disease resistance protein At1g61310 n=1 Tax=Chenopodium quinoa TaxID=63459 RepID=UPI000B77FFA1|nr:probable disease resistance protein At1g61310 [Chenopodium quinoa]